MNTHYALGAAIGTVAVGGWVPLLQGPKALDLEMHFPCQSGMETHLLVTSVTPCTNQYGVAVASVPPHLHLASDSFLFSLLPRG